MNSKSSISVILPNYNHYSFLQRRLDSIINQTFQDFELIILDDASTDDSNSLLKTYENHPKVSHLVINDKNSGSVFKQWIKGIELAQGDYIWIAESDDYAATDFLEKTVGKLKENRQLGMVFTDTFKVNENEGIIGQVSKSKPQLFDLKKNEGIIDSRNFTYYLLEKLVVVNASSVLFRKSALKNLDVKLLSQLKNAGDVFVYLSIVLKTSILYLPEALNFMRFHSRNSTIKNKKSGVLYRDQILLLNYYLDDFNKVSIDIQPILNYLFGFFFFSVDYGYRQDLKIILGNMYTKGFFDERAYGRIKNILLFYRFLYKGRPYFMRNWLKRKLQQELKV